MDIRGEYAEFKSSLFEDLDRGREPVRLNVNPKIWGPAGWTFIDKVIEGYPARRAKMSDQIAMTDFLTSLERVLPCKKCRKSFREYAEMNPPIEAVVNRRRAKQWLEAYKKFNKKP